MRIQNTPIIAVLRIKNFRYLWLGQIFSQFAVNILVFVLLITVYQRTSSNTAVSLLILTSGIPALLLGVIAGVFVDRWQKQKVLFWCNLFRAVVVLLLLLTHQFLFSVYLISTLVAIITQFFVPAEVPLIPLLVPKDLLFTANSVFTFSFYIAMTVGFVVSGPLLSIIGEVPTIMLVAFFLILAAYFVGRIPPESTTNFLPFGQILLRVKGELLQGLTFIKSKRGFGEAIAFFTASQAIIMMLAALAPGFADRVLLVSLTDATVVVMAPVVVGVILASVVLGNIGANWRKDRLVTIGIMGSGIVLLLLAMFVRIGYSPSLLTRMEKVVPDVLVISRLDVAMFLFFLFGVFNAAVIVPVNTFLQMQTEEGIRGKVYGLLTALGGGVSILPVLGAGKLADTIGVGKTIFFLACIISGFGFYRISRRKQSRI